MQTKNTVQGANSAREERIGEALVALRLVTREQLASAKERQSKEKLGLAATLVATGLITEERLLSALAAHLGVRPWRLDEQPPDARARRALNPDLCRKHWIIPVLLNGDLLTVGMVQPQDTAVVELVRDITGHRVEAVLVEPSALLRALDAVDGGSRASGPGLDQQLASLDNLIEAALEGKSTARREGPALLTEADTRPVVGLVNQILSEAIRRQASDIHLEPRADRIEVRYRIDGQLLLARTLPADLHPMLATRLKIMAEMDIVEWRVPQDGRMSVHIDGREVDLRVSMLPNYYGQRLVLRILDRSSSVRNLNQLGFTPEDLTLFRSLVDRPHGMFLVTGPTGSGKTTTLYAAIKELCTGTNNVMTCEDPIEYALDGVNQSMVNEKVGLTFAKQLRAILRQDPDVILVGEIRDQETAETAIRAALTGHMVLSTLHCNDAASALPRLLDMGLDPFLLGSSLTGVMAQRLVRQICPHCRKQVPTTDSEHRRFQHFGIPTPPQLSIPVGCQACAGTGYRGRIAVHEILPFNEAIVEKIVQRASLESIKAIAAESGYQPMAARALRCVSQGRTSIEEAHRVVHLGNQPLGSPVRTSMAA